MLSTLAVAAGVAIDNARLYEEARLRERWLRANAEITSGLLSGGRARRGARARSPSGPGRSPAPTWAWSRCPIDGHRHAAVELADRAGRRGAPRARPARARAACSGPAFTAAAPVISADIAHDERVFGRAAALRRDSARPWRCRSARRGGVRGVLLLARSAGATGVRRRGDRHRCRASPARRRWRWNWRNGAATPSRSPCWRTATGSPGTCTTWPSSGCSPPA